MAPKTRPISDLPPADKWSFPAAPAEQWKKLALLRSNDDETLTLVLEKVTMDRINTAFNNQLTALVELSLIYQTEILEGRAGIAPHRERKIWLQALHTINSMLHEMGVHPLQNAPLRKLEMALADLDTVGITHSALKPLLNPGTSLSIRQNRARGHIAGAMSSFRAFGFSVNDAAKLVADTLNAFPELSNNELTNSSGECERIDLIKSLYSSTQKRYRSERHKSVNKHTTEVTDLVNHLAEIDDIKRRHSDDSSKRDHVLVGYADACVAWARSVLR